MRHCQCGTSITSGLRCHLGDVLFASGPGLDHHALLPVLWLFLAWMAASVTDLTYFKAATEKWPSNRFRWAHLSWLFRAASQAQEAPVNCDSHGQPSLWGSSDNATHSMCKLAFQDKLLWGSSTRPIVSPKISARQGTCTFVFLRQLRFRSPFRCSRETKRRPHGNHIQGPFPAFTGFPIFPFR